MNKSMDQILAANVGVYLFWNSLFYIDDRDDEVAVRIHGMPFQATREEIYEFFADYKVVPDTLIYGLADDGRKSGLGSLIFENEEEAAKAAEEKDK